MGSLFFGVAVLACPIGMGAMMWLMMRGQSENSGNGSAEQQLGQLRSEIDELKAERAAKPTTGG